MNKSQVRLLKSISIILATLMSLNMTKAQSDAINIQNMFDTGVNLGNLSGHSAAGTGIDLIPIFVANAAAEWDASISPAPKPLVLAEPFPAGLGWDIQNIELALMIKSSGFCTNPWYDATTSIFRAGLELSRSYVIAGGACTGCLRNEMIRAGYSLIAVGDILSPSNTSDPTTFRTMGENLKAAALSMQNYPDAARAGVQNFNMAAGILDVINAVNALLPDAPIACSTSSSGTIPAGGTGTFAPEADQESEATRPAGDEAMVQRTSLCGEVQQAGGDEAERHTIQFSRSSGTFTFSYNSEQIADRFQVFNGNILLYDSDCVGTNGWINIPLTLKGYDQVVVQISPNCERKSSTVWSFRVSCSEETTNHLPGARTTGFMPGTSDKVVDGHTSGPNTAGVDRIPNTPTGPKKGAWTYHVDKNHPWVGKTLDEILKLGGNLQMYIQVSMSPNSYFLTDRDGKWINYVAGTHGPSTYRYVDWDAFHALYRLKESKPIINDADLYLQNTYEHKDGKRSTSFKIYRASDFDPYRSFPSNIYAWSVGKKHPWYGKSNQELQSMGIKPFMYFANTMDHNTEIYQDPFGQLVALTGGTKYVRTFDWNRFITNFSKVDEGNKYQVWQDNQSARKSTLKWY